MAGSLESDAGAVAVQELNTRSFKYGLHCLDIDCSTSDRASARACRWPAARQSNQVVGRSGEDEGPIDLLETAEFGLAHSADCFEPAEGFLDPLSNALAGGISGVARCPLVDGGSAPIGVLRHMRPDIECRQFLDKIRSVIAAIRAERNGLWPIRQRLDHMQRRKPLRMAGHAGQSGVDDQAGSVLHQPVAYIAKLGLHARPLAIEHGVGIGRALMRLVRALLTAKVCRRIASAVFWPIILATLRPEALHRRPGFN